MAGAAGPRDPRALANGRPCRIPPPRAAGDEWVYRRDPRVTLAWDLLSVESRLGVTVLSPEVVLLFKATGRRARDQADFDALLPRLADRQRAWLREALGIAHPGHRWLRDLG